jgi:hypothetical protein
MDNAINANQRKRGATPKLPDGQTVGRGQFHKAVRLQSRHESVEARSVGRLKRLPSD